MFVLSLLASIGLFTPPTSWQAVKSKDTSEHVQVGFVGKGSSEYRPSLSLATEVVDCTLKEYIKSVKAIHLEDPANQWHDLGNIQMKAGKGRLVKISSGSPWGDLAILQAIFVQDKTAYILTAGALKDDLALLQKEILDAFRSFDIQPDLFASIDDEALRSKLKATFENLGKQASESEWANLQTLIEQETSQLGSYWQYLALKSGYTKIHKQGAQ